ncbi:MAG TPA: hypothetical protein PKE69_05940 [Pyrinomonadaceae bacterium]|nr:hypothetical protein [Pyrinomonadaceae bacterium]
MREVILAKILISKKEAESEFSKSRKRWMNALFASSIFGIVLGVTGFVISALSLFGFLAEKQNVSRLGTWLIVAVFPLMMFAAHCLDKIGNANKAIKNERFKRQGMSGV